MAVAFGLAGGVVGFLLLGVVGGGIGWLFGAVIGVVIGSHMKESRSAMQNEIDELERRVAELEAIHNERRPVRRRITEQGKR